MGLFDFLKQPDEERVKADELVAPGEASHADENDEPEIDPALLEKSAPEDRAEHGPFDASEAPELDRVVDLGALRIPARDGLGLRLEVEEKSKRLVAVALDYQGSTMQVQAFAAPRSTGLWNTIRGQLAEQVAKGGGTSQEIDGPLGPELDTKLPVVGGEPMRSARFMGVDGPRWFLRAVLTGKALHDEEAAAAMEELFRSIVVVRGDGPMPPRDLLPLVIPQAMAQQMGQPTAQAAAARPADDRGIAERRAARAKKA